LRGEILNFADVYDLPPEAPFSFNRDFDERNEYRTQSMLSVPMKAPDGRVAGVLQLINAQNAQGEVIPFPEETEALVQALASQAAVAVRNAKLTSALRDAHLDTIFRLAVAAEYRDEDTARHIQRIGQYSRVLAVKLGMGLDEAQLIEQASPMHDVGKLGVPDAILLKPGKLTPEERKDMEMHAIYGGKILADSESRILRLSETIALTHHEKWDGSGYPYGISGDSIPLPGRIVAITDVFDALSNARCYKPAFPMEKVHRILREETGSHFDPKIAECFFDCFDEINDIFETLRERE